MPVKYYSHLAIFMLLLFTSAIIFFIAFFIDNYQVSIILMIIFGVFIGIAAYLAYYTDTILKRKYPNIENPEEIKELKDFLEKKEVKRLIRKLYYGFAMDVKEIGWKLEKKFKIKLHYHIGNKVFELKSPELIEKMANILGFKSVKQCWSDRYEYKGVRRYDLI